MLKTTRIVQIVTINAVFLQAVKGQGCELVAGSLVKLVLKFNPENKHIKKSQFNYIHITVPFCIIFKHAL